MTAVEPPKDCPIMDTSILSTPVPSNEDKWAWSLRLRSTLVPIINEVGIVVLAMRCYSQKLQFHPTDMDPTYLTHHAGIGVHEN